MNIVEDLIGKYLKPKPSLAVGLDIGNSSVKVLQLSAVSSSSEKELISYSIQPFKPQDRKSLVDAIKKGMDAAKIESKLVNTSVSGQSVIVRYIQLPRMTKEELHNALRLGVGKYIPFNLDDVNYDCQVLDDPGKNKNEKMMRVLLVAAKKGIIDDKIAVLKDAGLVPNVIDVDSFAIVNSFQLVSQENKGVVAVLDIGADITSTTILVDNVPYFNRDIPVAGRHLTSAIIEELEMTIDEAEKLKHEPGDKYGDLIEAVRPILETLAREIQMSFNYCESQIGGGVHKIFLTGGTAKLKGIDKVLNGIIGVDVEIWDPTRILKLNSALSQENLKDIGPLLTVSVGLALRG